MRVARPALQKGCSRPCLACARARLPRVTVKAAEQLWHDTWYRSHPFASYFPDPQYFQEHFRRTQLTPFYEGGWSWWGDARKEMMDMVGEVPRKAVLDYGCGSGNLGIYLALEGAKVSGFDLSPEGVKIAQRAAEQYGLDAQFQIMDAEALSYADASFDVVVGFGVLHHVIKYPGASAQLLRVMRPGARAFFHETLWDNPFINLARRFTMKDESAGDAHLTAASLREFSHGFSRLTLHRRHLLYMLKRMVKLQPGALSEPLHPRSLWKVVKSVDRVLTSAGLARWCGEVIVELAR